MAGTSGQEKGKVGQEEDMVGQNMDEVEQEMGAGGTHFVSRGSYARALGRLSWLKRPSPQKSENATILSL